MHNRDFRTRHALVLLLGLAALGTLALSGSWATVPEARRDAYVNLHWWQCAFDACSAACGAGLLTFEYGRDYAGAGKALLLALSIAGALVFIAFVTAAEARCGLGPAAHCRKPVFAALLAWCLTAVACAATAVTFRLLGAGGDFPPLLELQIAAGFGPALIVSAEGRALVLAIAAMALLLPPWLMTCVARATSPDRRRLVQVTAAQTLCGVCVLALLAGAVALLERPRGVATALPGDAANLTGISYTARQARAAQAVVGAAVGVATEDAAGGGVTEGTRLLLALALLVGGPAAAATGGLRWPLLAQLLRLQRPGAGGPGERAEVAPAGRDCNLIQLARGAALAFGGVVLLVALGMLALDAIVATRYAAPLALADSLLDAAAAVGGGGLSGGAAGTLTNRNLSTGMGQPSDLYPYGMAWLMLAMFAGRVLPIWLLRRGTPMRPR